MGCNTDCKTGFPFMNLTKILLAPALLLILCLIFPPELSLKLGSFRITLYRLILLIAFLPCLYRLLAGSCGKVVLADLMMIGHAAWVLVALTANEGLATAAESGGIYVIESLGAYLIARVYIRSFEDFQRLSLTIVVTVSVLMIFAIPESLTGNHFIREAFKSIFPSTVLPNPEPRLGIDRAYGPFDHPILYGVFCASAFSMAFYIVGGYGRKSLPTILPALAVVLATFFSLSGGPYIALFLQMSLIFWEKITKNIRYRWFGPVVIVSILWMALELLSNRSPILVFVSYLSFSKNSGYARVRIFEYGIAEVERHAFFGIGYAEWTRPSWMPDSVDNFWLLTAMRFGVPSVLFLLIAMLNLVFMISGQKKHDQDMVASRRAWGFTLAGMVLAGCTVSFWNSLFVLFFYIMGSGVWLTEQRSGASQVRPKKVSISQKAHRSTLF
jgi:hypothetical protein